MRTRGLIGGGGALAVALCLLGFEAAPAAPPAQAPETVMVTYRAKQGAEGELTRVLADHWSTAKRLKLVLPQPHIVVRRAESGQTADFVEIFAWRDGSIPDNAPKPIRSMWEQMGKLVEARDGHPGIDIVTVKIVQ